MGPAWFKNIAVKIEEKQNCAFTYPVDKQTAYVARFPEPKDGIERGYFQYCCRMKLYGKPLHFLMNLSALPLSLYYLATYPKTGVALEQTADAVFFHDGKPFNIVPDSLQARYQSIVSSAGDGKVLGKEDRKFLKAIFRKYPVSWMLWLKVIVAVLPSALAGVVLDDLLDTYLYNYIVVAVMLILYGAAFLFVEKLNEKRTLKINTVYDIDFKTAIFIGAFQCLSLIPGTSRSGATILGAILLGVSRSAGAEFSFFLAIPTMLGASALKVLKFLMSETTASSTEIVLLLVGCVVSFVVSLLVIKALMEYVRKRSFAVFGYYRIGLGVLVLLYFTVKHFI